MDREHFLNDISPKYVLLCWSVQSISPLRLQQLLNTLTSMAYSAHLKNEAYCVQTSLEIKNGQNSDGKADMVNMV